jgi:hypothetical protein
MSTATATSSVLAIALVLAQAGVASAQARGGPEACPNAAVAGVGGRASSTVPHGIQEFDGNALFVVPDGVASLTVELWGAGGGGGGGSTGSWQMGGAGGGGGASGAYVRTTLSVAPGHAYALFVGKGGRGGAGGGQPTAGENGQDSLACDGDTVLVRAPGGPGGKPSPNNGRRGIGGVGVAADPSVDTSAGLRRRGNNGANGLDPLFERGGNGGLGAYAVIGTVRPVGSFGGSGGAGEYLPDPAQNGWPGGDGSIIVSW